jgi:hypothetical protein
MLPQIAAHAIHSLDHSFMIPGHSVILPGHSIILPGYSVMLPGRSIVLPGHSVMLSGFSVMFSAVSFVTLQLEKQQYNAEEILKICEPIICRRLRYVTKYFVKTLLKVATP